MGTGLLKCRAAILDPHTKTIFNPVNHAGGEVVSIVRVAPDKPRTVHVVARQQIVFLDHYSVNDYFSANAQRNILCPRSSEFVLEVFRNKTADYPVNLHCGIEFNRRCKSGIFPDRPEGQPGAAVRLYINSKNKNVRAAGFGLNQGLLGHNVVLAIADPCLPADKQQLPNSDKSQNPIGEVSAGYNPLPFILGYCVLGFIAYRFGYEIERRRHG